jgi:hypothetical protein
MFFSVFSTGVDPDRVHTVALKIGGIDVPGALNALIADGSSMQRFNFIVDTQKHPRIRRATCHNIEVWVDGSPITPRSDDR